VVVNLCKSLIIKCDLCNRLKEYEFNLFNILKYDKIEYECLCGRIIKINVGKKSVVNNRIISFKINDEILEFPLHTIISRDNIFRTRDNSLIFFLGDKKLGRNKIKEMGMEVGDIVSEGDRRDIFTNFDIITRALIRLFDMDKNDKIKCDCGSSSIKIELFSDRIELECLSCHSVKLIFAETEEDLDVIMNKDVIILKKNDISCIDSIVDSNKHIKK